MTPPESVSLRDGCSKSTDSERCTTDAITSIRVIRRAINDEPKGKDRPRRSQQERHRKRHDHPDGESHGATPQFITTSDFATSFLSCNCRLQTSVRTFQAQ